MRFIFNRSGIGLVKDSFTYSLSKVIPGLMGLLSVVVFFKLTGPVEYGKYSILFSFLMIVSTFCFGWLNQATLRYYSRYNTSGLFSKTLHSGLLYASLFMLAIIFIASRFQLPVPASFFIQLTLALSIAAFTFLTILFQAQRHPQKVLKLTAFQSVMGLAFPVLYITLLGSSHTFILLGLVTAYALPALFFFKSFGSNPGKNNNATTAESQRQLTGEFFSFGWPLSIWFVGSLSLPFLDRFFIQTYWGDSLMGSYAGFSELVVRLFSVLLFPVTLSLHPRMMQAWNENRRRDSLQLLFQGVLLQVVIFAACLGVFSLLARYLFDGITILIPSLDRQLLPLLIPILVGGFLWQFALLAHKPLELVKKTRLMLLFIVLSVVVNILGNTIFLPRFGPIATAYTTIASGGVYCILSLLFSVPTIRMGMASSLRVSR